MKRKRIVKLWTPAYIYPIQFSERPNLVPVKMTGGWTCMVRLIHGRLLVPRAFIPENRQTICSKCQQMRTLMTIHCEHCDAPLMGFEGVERTPADNYAKHGALCFCDECLRNPKQQEQTEMDFTKRATPINQPRQPRGSSGQAFERRNFLKAMDLPAGPRGKDGKPILVKVEGFRDAPENMPYSQFLIDVRIGKVPYVIGIKDESDTKLNNIISTLGPKTDRWAGKTIKMYAGWWDREQKHVVRIVGKGKK